MTNSKFGIYSSDKFLSGILSEQNQKLIKIVKKSKKSKNYGEIALKLCSDYLQGLNEQEQQDLYMFQKQYEWI